MVILVMRRDFQDLHAFGPETAGHSERRSPLCPGRDGCISKRNTEGYVASRIITFILLHLPTVYKIHIKFQTLPNELHKF